ncbi:CHAT domain-containing protein [Candidatus Viridilinea mediisalina]|uniref:CHAT domain-containing protein n=1 Tax=Candidatus Viridilinea mediisalina TaxID=2024553 RepID=A0A2A6RL78_9CHLR|nr:CHAT domain-containing protein [Candidatus Viridilinea mediisalina]PDW03665.1 hypothetical protein CJ255_07510 [Candidatus Viridilinea mediisalina]
MHEPADLELVLRRKDALRYGVELRLNLPGSEAEVRPLGQHVVSVAFDPQTLLAQMPDPVAYGQALTQMLFADASLVSAFAAARAAAQSQGCSLRLRLAIAADASELHALHWETLHDPQYDQVLALSEQVLLTRSLASTDWQPVKLRAKGTLRALVVIANPVGLTTYNLVPLDVAQEREVALRGLAGITTTVLAEATQATLNLMIAQLREGYDICYIIAHGLLVDDEPYLFLADEQGEVTRVAGRELSERMADLPARPRLVLLASCQSAGAGTPAALAALGPRLALAGIPAVLAMQGLLAMDTNARFTPAFFRELQRDGRVDRALAAARQELSQQNDWWQPALFTRLRSGRIWYEPGFDPNDFAKWPALIRSIERGKCTPILGPGLLEGLLGSTRDMAQRLAEKHHFPLAPNARDDLPQVAQYLAVNQAVDFMRDEVEETLRAAMSERDPATVAQVPLRTPLAKLLSAVGAARRATHADEPHRILASLRLPIYLTANSDPLLAEALEEAQRTPQVIVCPWHLEEKYATESEIEAPTDEAPLVFHLLGSFADPDSLVITEDDYFRYLIGVRANVGLIPPEVQRALADTALLFVGFRFDDWSFRALLQSMLRISGGQRRNQYAHVAVQIDPQEETTLNPQAARQYLKDYFGPAAVQSYQANISVYWGSAEDFLRELSLRVTRSTVE